jgi:hypothetical protein
MYMLKVNIGICSYRAVNTLQLSYKSQSLNFKLVLFGSIPLCIDKNYVSV